MIQKMCLFSIFSFLALVPYLFISPVEAGQKRETSFCEPQVVTTWEQQDIFNKFVSDFYIEKDITTALHLYVQEEYIQHNPFVLSGAQPAINYLAPLFPQLNVTIYHLAFDQGNGYVHYRITGNAFPVETAIVDIYRFNGSCVIEHWDVIETLPANATNPLALF